MAYWEVDNIWAYLKEATIQEQSSLYNLLRCRPKGYIFDYRWRAGMWDGYNYYFDRTQQRMLAGLVTTVQEMGFEWEARYLVNAPFATTGSAALEGITFSGKQERALQLVREGKNRGIFDLITGAGKTVLSAGITKMLNVQTLIIVPSIALLSQFSEEVTRLTGLPCGKIGGGHNDEDMQVTVVVDETVKRLPKWRTDKWAKKVQLLQMDEVHNCTDKLAPFIKACESAYFRYGFSGTPFDMGKDRATTLLGLFGPVLLSADDKDLVESKRGVPADFIFVECELPRTKALDYGEMYQNYIVANSVLHNQTIDLIEKHADGNTSILVLVKRIEHGKCLLELLQKRRIQAEFTSGRDQAYKREQVKQKFKAGDLKVLVASDIYKEGVDLPCIDVLILATAGLSSKDWKQRVGRGLRAHPGKDKVIVYDFLFTGNKLFASHSAERMKNALSLESAKVFKLNTFLGEPILVTK